MYGVLLGNGTRRKRAVFNNEEIGVSLNPPIVSYKQRYNFYYLEKY